MPRNSYSYRERIYDRYVSAGDLVSADSDGLKSRGPFFRKLIREYFPANRDAAIFDIGCGHGALLYFARLAGYRNISGIDISDQQVAAAHRLGIDGVAHGDLFETVQILEKESLDAVVTLDFIEHFRKEELLDLVDEIFRVLRKNGTWIIHAPNGGSPFFGGIRYGDFTHEQAFTRSSVEQLAFASGFEQVRCFEDSPIPHGVKSSIRWILWKAIRFVLRICLLVETGAGSSESIFTQNLIATVKK